MGRSQNEQSGFSIVEAVIVVAVIGIIGVLGLFVYQQNRLKVADAAANTNQTPSQQTTTAMPAPAQNVVEIPELGIQLTVPNTIKDLTYQISTVTLRNGQQATLAKFSTASLTATDPDCNPASMVLGTLERASGQYPTQTQDETNVLDYGKLVKQFPTFYISGSMTHAGTCLPGKSSPATAISHAQDFSAVLSTIKPSK